MHYKNLYMPECNFHWVDRPFWMGGECVACVEVLVYEPSENAVSEDIWLSVNELTSGPHCDAGA